MHGIVSWRNGETRRAPTVEKIVVKLLEEEAERERETWWWNDTVQQIIKEKKAAFRKWQRSGAEVDNEVYKRKKREAQRIVGDMKKEAWSQWSQDLNTREGRNKLFRVASQMKEDKKIFKGVALSRMKMELYLWSKMRWLKGGEDTSKNY